MTELVVLWTKLEAARIALECAGMTNTAGQNPETRVAIDLEYRRAMHRYDEAYRAYNTAIMEAI